MISNNLLPEENKMTSRSSQSITRNDISSLLPTICDNKKQLDELQNQLIHQTSNQQLNNSKEEEHLEEPMNEHLKRPMKDPLNNLNNHILLINNVSKFDRLNSNQTDDLMDMHPTRTNNSGIIGFSYDYQIVDECHMSSERLSELIQQQEQKQQREQEQEQKQHVTNAQTWARAFEEINRRYENNDPESTNSTDTEDEYFNEAIRTPEIHLPSVKRHSYKVMPLLSDASSPTRTPNIEVQNISAQEHMKRWLETHPNTPEQQKVPLSLKEEISWTPEQVKEQLCELENIEEKMTQVKTDSKGGINLLRTIQFFKDQQNHSTHQFKGKKKYRYFPTWGYNSLLSKEQGNHDIKAFSNKWGTTDEINWTSISSNLFNEPIRSDIHSILKIIDQGKFNDQLTAMQLSSCMKWLSEFRSHVVTTTTLKSSLYDERSLLLDASFLVKTCHTSFEQLMDEAFTIVNTYPFSSKVFGTKVQEAMKELLQCLDDEEHAVNQLLQDHLSENMEYEALFNFFNNLAAANPSEGIVLSKIWQKLYPRLNARDKKELFSCLSKPLQYNLLHHWKTKLCTYQSLLISLES